jgi:hypothetical protein
MTAEGAIAITAALLAGSIALLGYSGIAGGVRSRGCTDASAVERCPAPARGLGEVDEGVEVLADRRRADAQRIEQLARAAIVETQIEREVGEVGVISHRGRVSLTHTQVGSGMSVAGQYGDRTNRRTGALSDV